MLCEINSFRQKYNMGDGNILQFESVREMMASQANRDAVKINRAAQNEDFNKDLIFIDRENKRLQILPDNIEEYNRHITKNILNEKHIDEITDELFGEEEVSVSLTEMYDDTEEEVEAEYPSFTQNFDTSNSSNPETLGEWKKSLFERIEVLDKQSKENMKRGLSKTEFGQATYNALLKLQKIYDKIDLKDPNTVYEAAVKEMEILKEFLKDFKTDKISYEKFEASDIGRRIMDMAMFFASIDKNGRVMKFEEYDEKNSSMVFYHHFIQENAGNQKDIEKLEKTASDLYAEYKSLTGKLIDNYMKNDEFFIFNRESGKFNEEAVEGILDLLRKGKIETESIDFNQFLGLHYAGPLGQILQHKINNIRNQETGKTQIAMNRFIKNYDKLLNKKIPGTDLPLSMLLYGKDKNGVRKNLISKFSKNFTDILRSNAILYKEFKRSRSASSYSNMMKNEKRNFDYIRPELIPELKELFGDHPAFKDYFEYSDSEMKEYEKTLKDYLGITYNNYKKEIINKVKEYVSNFDSNNFYSSSDAELKNPFLFSKHFYSENYDKIGPSGYYNHKISSVLIPKVGKEEYINKDFEEIEKHPEAETLLQMYADALELTAYANPILEREGVFLGNHGIMDFIDEYGEEAIKQKNIFGKIRYSVGLFLKKYRKSFFDSHSDNLRRKRGYTNELKDKTFYGIYHERAQLSDLYYNDSLEDLENKMIERGYDIKKTNPSKSENSAIRRRKRELANSLAQDDMNKIVKLNLAETLHATVNLAIEKETSKQAAGIHSVILDYAKQKNAKNLTQYLEEWGLLNIYGEHRFKDKALVGDDKLNRVGSFLTAGTDSIKSRSKAEDLIYKKLKEQYTKFKAGDPMLFTTKNERGQKVFYRRTAEGHRLEFTNSEGNYERKNVSADTFTKEFQDYYMNKMKDLGTRLTVGGVAGGLQGIAASGSLLFNGRSGFANRHQGFNQNSALAAEGTYGFNDSNYYKATKFLSMSNIIGKYGKKFIGMKETEKMKNWYTTELLLNQLGLSQSMIEDLFSTSKSGVDKFMEGILSFGHDLSVNNAEWHNQAELLVSIAQNVMLKTNAIDKDGNPVYKPLFDAKKMQWAYIPGTTQLRNEFRNPENIEMWENFKQTVDKNGAVLTDSTRFANKVSVAIKKTSGNYSDKDLVPFQATTWGNSLLFFKKYVAENLATQYATQSVDLKKGEVNVKGRKIVLFEHMPTLALYTALNYNSLVGWIFGGFAAFGAMSGLGLGVAVGSMLFPLAVGIYTRKLKLSTLADLKEFKLLAHFAKEIGIRSATTTMSRLTRGLQIVSQEKLDSFKSAETAEKYGMTQQDMALLSANAQELANKTHTIIMKTMVGLALKGLLLLLSPPPDDEDEKKVKNWFDKLIDVEKAMNSLMNYSAQINSDIGQYTNPSAMWENMSTSILYKIWERRLGISKDIYKILEGKKEFDSDFTMKMANTIGILPNTVYKVISPDKAIFEDDRAYVKQDFIDKIFIRSGIKGSDKEYKKELTEMRENLKPKVQDLYEQILEEKYKGLDKSSGEIENEAKDLTEDFMKRTYKGTDSNGKRNKQYSNESSEETYYRKIQEWDNILNPLEKELENLKKKK